MTRNGLILALMTWSLVLIACSKLGQVTLFNNTDEVIEVRAGSEHETIAPNRSAQFKRPGESANLAFRLSNGRCEYLYDISSNFGYGDDRYTAGATSDRGIQIQVEKDFSINLLPVTYTGDTPASSDVILKKEGFPLRPVSRKCL